jgi:hypothetical protein
LTEEFFKQELIEALQTKGENLMRQSPHNEPSASASSSAPLSQEQGREK